MTKSPSSPELPLGLLLAPGRVLRVRNWHKFQHYPDRKPIWIKNYLDLDDPSELFAKLSFADQGRLQKMWRLAAKLGNEIPDEDLYLSRALGMKPAAIRRTVVGYLVAGWLQSGSQTEVRRWASAEKRAAKRGKAASRTLEAREQNACLELELEEEKNPSAVREGPGVGADLDEQRRDLLKKKIDQSLRAVS